MKFPDDVSDNRFFDDVIGEVVSLEGTSTVLGSKATNGNADQGQ